MEFKKALSFYGCCRPVEFLQFVQESLKEVPVQHERSRDLSATISKSIEDLLAVERQNDASWGNTSEGFKFFVFGVLDTKTPRR